MRKNIVVENTICFRSERGNGFSNTDIISLIIQVYIYWSHQDEILFKRCAVYTHMMIDERVGGNATFRVYVREISSLL